jgi:uncharacterized membrane protein YgaE (UPF0421/DUF939 family)
MIGIIISTVIIIIVNVIRKVVNKMSKNPENTSCTNFKNTTLNILLTIAVIINFYFIIPKQFYKYKEYQHKLEDLEMKHSTKLNNELKNNELKNNELKNNVLKNNELN